MLALLRILRGFNSIFDVYVLSANTFTPNHLTGTMPPPHYTGAPPYLLARERRNRLGQRGAYRSTKCNRSDDGAGSYDAVSTGTVSSLSLGTTCTGLGLSRSGGEDGDGILWPIVSVKCETCLRHVRQALSLVEGKPWCPFCRREPQVSERQERVMRVPESELRELEAASQAMQQSEPLSRLSDSFNHTTPSLSPLARAGSASSGMSSLVLPVSSAKLSHTRKYSTRFPV